MDSLNEQSRKAVNNYRESLGGMAGARVRLSSMIDQKLLEILACPIDKQPLEDPGDYLVNPSTTDYAETLSAIRPPSNRAGRRCDGNDW